MSLCQESEQKYLADLQISHLTIANPFMTEPLNVFDNRQSSMCNGNEFLVEYPSTLKH